MTEQTTPEQTTSPAPGLVALDAASMTKGRQSKETVQHFRTPGGTRVRLKIVCDSVGFQSYAQASVLDPTTFLWNVVASVPYGLMHTVRANVNPYRTWTHHEHEAFDRDRDELLNKISFLLD